MATLSNKFVIEELHCIVCDDIIQSDLVNKSKHKNGDVCQKFCLLACRYLNFRCDRYNPSKTITSNFSPSQGCKDKNDELRGHFLCEKCLLLANSFCSICDQWNYVEILYKWRLKTTAEMIKERMEKFKDRNDRNKSKNGGSKDDGMEDFRAKFSTQVNNKVFTEWPRLRLNKQETRNLTTQADIPDKSSNLFSPENVNQIPEEIALGNENKELADIAKTVCNQDTCLVPCSNNEIAPEPTLVNPATQIFDINHEKSYKCKICEKKFIRKDNCMFHEKLSHKIAIANNISVNCDSQIDPLRTTSVNEIVAAGIVKNADILNHDESFHSNKIQSSENCHDNVHLNKDLYQHSTNWQNRHGKFCCRFCGRHFGQKFHLVRHLRTHTGERPFKCNICEKGFIQLYNLQMHQKRTHKQCDIKTNNKNLRCKSKRKLSQNHEGVETTAVLDKTMPVCVQPVEISSISVLATKPATAIYKLENHQNKIIQTITEPTSCSSKTTTADNVGSEVGKEITCEVCSKRFINRQKLKTHLKKVHGPRVHKCKICAKSFTVRSKLVRHEQIHIGETPYQCLYCGKRFGRKENCSVHERNVCKRRDIDVVKDNINQSATFHSNFEASDVGQKVFTENDLDIPDDILNLQSEAGPIVLHDLERDQKFHSLNFFSEYILPDN